MIPNRLRAVSSLVAAAAVATCWLVSAPASGSPPTSTPASTSVPAPSAPGPFVGPPAPGGLDSEVVAAILAREDELLDVVERTDPIQYARLTRLRDLDRAAYVAALFRVARTVERARDDPDSVERWRVIREREEQVRALAVGFAALSAEDQGARRAQMTALARELLELKQVERRVRLEELRARLEQLEQEISAREAARSRIVDEYVDRMLRDR